MSLLNEDGELTKNLSKAEKIPTGCRGPAVLHNGAVYTVAFSEEEVEKVIKLVKFDGAKWKYL